MKKIKRLRAPKILKDSYVFKKIDKHVVIDFFKMTLGAIFMIFGNYFFKFPNNFAFGGVAGGAIVIAQVMPWSVGTVNFVLNTALLIIGFFVLSRKFGAKTIYVSMFISIGISILEKVYPLYAPLTNQPTLEFMFAIILTAVGSGILFQCDASSGGTDIIAMMMKKMTGLSISITLFATDALIAILAFFLFDIQTALFSVLGLILKSIVIDNTIASINRCKYAHIVCDEPDHICKFIIRVLGKSATVINATGAYSHKPKFIVMCVLRGRQEIVLRRFIKEHEANAFVLISNTSEIFGKGFLPME